MTLVITLAERDTWRLQSYGRGRSEGGFQSLSQAMAAALTVEPDGSGTVRLRAWNHIRAFVQQRDGRTPGGFQLLLRRCSAALYIEDAAALDDWPAIRTHVLERERAHSGVQVRLGFTFATCGEGTGAL